MLVYRGITGANAWVLGRYGDGRLRLVSVTGQIKNVTNETALGFHRDYMIVGCTIAKDGVLIPPPNDYISLKAIDTAKAQILKLTYCRHKSSY